MYSKHWWLVTSQNMTMAWKCQNKYPCNTVITFFILTSILNSYVYSLVIKMGSLLLYVNNFCMFEFFNILFLIIFNLTTGMFSDVLYLRPPHMTFLFFIFGFVGFLFSSWNFEGNILNNFPFNHQFLYWYFYLRPP